MSAHLVAAALLLVLLPGAATARPAPEPVRARSYIVVLDSGGGRPRDVAAAHARAHGVDVSHVYRSAILGYAARIPTAQVDEVRADPRVASVVPDRPVRALAQWKPTGIRRIGAPTSSTSSGDGSGAVDLDVAVIDTGIDVDHPDLNVVGGANCSSGDGFDDRNGHGTHVAGTIAARDNAIGVVGVAPGARLWSVRVLDRSGSGTNATVLCGIDFVVAHAPANGGPIAVANMSIGGPGSDDGACGEIDDDPVHTAICEGTSAGVLFVAAAGNARSTFEDQIPAAYDEVLTVTAVADFDGRPGGRASSGCIDDVDDTAANFSDFAIAGSPDESHVIAAPGVCISSTWKGDRYRKLSGTSMATPHVAGAAALCIASERCAGRTPSQIAALLRSDAAARPAWEGFVGDPLRPIVDPDGRTRAYGSLVDVRDS